MARRHSGARRQAIAKAEKKRRTRRTRKPLPPKPVFEKPPRPRSRVLTSAHELLEHGIDSTNDFAYLYDVAMHQRGAGAPSYWEQDVLRAMLVMAGAALDAVVKRVILNSFDALVAKNDKARKTACDHVQRKLLKNLEEGGGQRLAAALLSESPRSAIVTYIIQDVTRGSLQSAEELQRAANYLGIESIEVSAAVREALGARNQIIHEMDAVEPGKGTRRRRRRKKEDMRAWAKALLKLASEFLHAVDQVLEPT